MGHYRGGGGSCRDSCRRSRGRRRQRGGLEGWGVALAVEEDADGDAEADGPVGSEGRSLFGYGPVSPSRSSLLPFFITLGLELSDLFRRAATPKLVHRIRGNTLILATKFTDQYV